MFHINNVIALDSWNSPFLGRLPLTAARARKSSYALHQVLSHLYGFGILPSALDAAFLAAFPEQSERLHAFYAGHGEALNDGLHASAIAPALSRYDCDCLLAQFLRRLLRVASRARRSEKRGEMALHPAIDVELEALDLPCRNQGRQPIVRRSATPPVRVAMLDQLGGQWVDLGSGVEWFFDDRAARVDWKVAHSEELSRQCFDSSWRIPSRDELLELAASWKRAPAGWFWTRDPGVDPQSRAVVSLEKGMAHTWTEEGCAGLVLVRQGARVSLDSRAAA